jgi:hypothetical protein
MTMPTGPKGHEPGVRMGKAPDTLRRTLIPHSLDSGRLQCLDGCFCKMLASNER